MWKERAVLHHVADPLRHLMVRRGGDRDAVDADVAGIG
jgi:hypothetical protein